MYVTPDQVAAVGKANVEAALGFAQSNFAALEKLSALNFNATKGAFEDSMNHAKALMNVKDVQEFMNVNVAATQPAIEKAIAWQRSVYELASQSQAEYTRYFEAQTQELNKSAARVMARCGPRRTRACAPVRRAARGGRPFHEAILRRRRA